MVGLVFLIGCVIRAFSFVLRRKKNQKKGKRMEAQRLSGVGRCTCHKTVVNLAPIQHRHLSILQTSLRVG